MPLEKLFSKLQSFGFNFDSESFELYSSKFDTPEEMGASLSLHHEDEAIYLIIFELWRRLFPERRSLSIFATELNQYITEYENGTLASLEKLHDALAELQYLLDENVDEGVSPEEGWAYMQSWVVNDLEGFLFNYILSEIDQGDFQYAHDLLEGFYRYVEEKTWFDFLFALVEIAKDPELGFEILEDLIENRIKPENDCGLELEILSFLASSGNHSLFASLALHTIFALETEEDFLELAHLTEEHFHSLDLESAADQIKQLLSERPERALDLPFSKEDPDLCQLHKILSQKLTVL